MTDTIYAPATAPGRAAVAIIRISGPGAASSLERISGAALPRARHAVVRHLISADGELIDQALVLWLPGPASFTGEDCVELHTHGGFAVLEAVTAELASLGLRSAEPGEFSRRAFANGKLDLLQAEAVADLVDAQTTAQRRQALSQMAGDIGRRFETWRARLLEALALIEAENDFPDEDLPGSLAELARPALSAVEEDLQSALASAARGRAIRSGFRVALIGAPNAGKSSLLNALARRDVAIVSQHAGTTRDIIETELVLDGYSVIVADTAGLRHAEDEVEQQGVDRAQRWAAQADLRVLLVAPDVPQSNCARDLVRPGDLVVFSKADLRSGLHSEDQSWAEDAGLEPVLASGATELGVVELLSKLRDKVVGALDADEPAFATRARHEEALRSALAGVSRAQTVLSSGPERAAEDIRQAAKALQSVIGVVDREAVLDRVFSSFCIGK